MYTITSVRLNWYDGDNRRSVVSDNLVTDNTHVGIMYEISRSGVIRGNTVTGNGTVHKGVYGSVYSGRLFRRRGGLR